MKKIVCFILIICGGVLSSHAQKFGYIDSEYILRHMPEYAEAQKQLDALSEQWQQDIERRQAEIEQLYKAYQSEQVLLTPEMRQKREQEIVEKEQSLRDFQRGKFGFEGELYGKRKELVKPVQDKIYKAVEEVAKDGLYAVIFDRTSELIMLYADERFDKSDDVLEVLGLNPGEFVE
ncbi:MAG TPA: OmpH family outer membrane protein [Anseongella sp.]|nr:OmpH family outer membrane protein [Anseongella sp.]